MTSLSNLIKATQYIPVDHLKQLDLAKSYFLPGTTEIVEDDGSVHEIRNRQLDEEAEAVRQEMLHDAQEFAERQIREASEEAERIKAEAEEQIAAWWQEKREQDEHLVEAVKSEGFHQGYEEAREQIMADLQQQIDEMMNEARNVLQEAYRAKEQIIQEAEPFLVELSCSIAEKVIDHQLSIEPNYVVELIQRNLARKREQGVITLCVSPTCFNLVQAAREELTLVIDSQAELQILPDSSVKDQGCVIRSAYGSVDARIDTQLSEIKKELLRISLQNEEGSANEDA